MSTQSIVGEPEVLEDSVAWRDLKAAVEALRPLQTQDGSIPDESRHAEARVLVAVIKRNLLSFQSALPHDTTYLEASARDFERWAAEGFGVPDFLDSLD